MKNLSIITILGILILSACGTSSSDKKTSKTVGALTISDATPNPGEDLNISYSLDEAIMNTPSATIYYWVQSVLYPQDIELSSDSGKTWKATISIPDSATAIAFNFKVNGEYDLNDKKGYVFPLYTEKDSIVPGGNASKVLFYQRYGQRYGLEMEEDSMVNMFKNAFEKHPDIRPEWEKYYAFLLLKTNAKKGKAYIKEQISHYDKMQNLSLQEYENLLFFHQRLKNKEKVDSITAIAIEAYPESEIARDHAMKEFYAVNDITEREKFLESFSTRFPGESQEKDRMLRSLALMYMAADNIKMFKQTATRISDKITIASLYNNVAWNMAEKRENLEEAASLSKKSLELLDLARGDMSGKPSSFTQSQYLENIDSRVEMYSDTYAFILFKQGKIDEALKYQEIAVGDGENGEINQRYIQYLTKAEKLEKVKKIAAEYIKNNAATGKVINYYKEAFLESGGTEEEYRGKIKTLLDKAHEKAIAELKADMIKKRAPYFSLLDLMGNEVNLTSLKGKTVILDFWATWCGPCKASFPGTQKAVEKYQDNENVVFLFVNTFERGESRHEKVSNFIARNHYDFHVLLDEQKKDSRDFSVAGSYGVTGIPTKFVIGPEGNIRFKEVGYGGNNRKMLQKIDLMIDLAQK